MREANPVSGTIVMRLKRRVSARACSDGVPSFMRRNAEAATDGVL